MVVQTSFVVVLQTMSGTRTLKTCSRFKDLVSILGGIDFLSLKNYHIDVIKNNEKFTLMNEDTYTDITFSIYGDNTFRIIGQNDNMDQRFPGGVNETNILRHIIHTIRDSLRTSLSVGKIFNKTKHPYVFMLYDQVMHSTEITLFSYSSFIQQACFNHDNSKYEFQMYRSQCEAKQVICYRDGFDIGTIDLSQLNTNYTFTRDTLGLGSCYASIFERICDHLVTTSD